MRSRHATPMPIADSRQSAQLPWCPQCRWAGFVLVPDLARGEAGEIVLARKPNGRLLLSPVSCRCERGSKRGTDGAGNKIDYKDGNGQPYQLMTVAQYEEINPEWMKQLAEEERTERMKIFEGLEEGSPFRWIKLTPEHDLVGKSHTERGEAVCIAAGLSCLEVAKALRLHPGWVEHGRINERIARDIVGAIKPGVRGGELKKEMEGVLK